MDNAKYRRAIREPSLNCKGGSRRWSSTSSRSHWIKTDDRAAFTDNTNQLMNHLIDMAVQGYGWTAA